MIPVDPTMLGILNFIAPSTFCPLPIVASQSPSCLSSAPQSLILVVSPRSATFVTTRSGRCMQQMSLNGMRFSISLATTAADDGCAHRQALRYIIRNTTLPQRVRAQAQLQLTEMHCYTRFTQIKNRCIMGGKGRGVFSDFRLGRVRRQKHHGSETEANAVPVPIPNQRACRESAGSEEGELVDRLCGGSVEHVYIITRQYPSIGRRFSPGCVCEIGKIIFGSTCRLH